MLFADTDFVKLHNIDSPGHSAQLTQATTEVVKNVKCPAVHTHSIVHVVDEIIKQFNLTLKINKKRI